MKKIVKVLTVAALLYSAQSHAIKARSTPIPGTQVGVAYMLPDDSKIYGQNFDTYMHPASTLKVITGLAAILYLGHDYTFKTTLEVAPQSATADGKIKTDANGNLNSDVVIRFTGDPSFTAKHYQTLLHTLKTNKVKRIAGDIIIDVSRFGGMTRGNGWSWDDTPICFTAPAGAAIINKNCVFAQLQPQGKGVVAKPVLSSSSPITLTSDAVGVEASSYGGNCELQADLYMNNEYHITGCVPISANNKPWPLSLSVSDPDAWAKDWTANILKGQNITYNNIKVSHSKTEGYAAVGMIESKPLSDITRYMLHRSNNLYADAIAKTVAAEYYKLPATYPRTVRALRSVLSRYANIDLGNSYLVDGNGLSPHNLVTPHKMLEILQFININNEKIHFIELLPVADESGTLHWRSSTRNPPLGKNVTAKTGTIQNVSNLMGFMKTKTGKRIPFVFYTNSISYDQKTRDLVKYHKIASPHLGYERYVLEQIYDEKVMGRDF
ncbi:MAG: D-alanyl-D-alanine carboxypeptidase/D-alanyl-D-alanine-endopeptidase [Succinivibrio sp.]